MKENKGKESQLYSFLAWHEWHDVTWLYYSFNMKEKNYKPNAIIIINFILSFNKYNYIIVLCIIIIWHRMRQYKLRDVMWWWWGEWDDWTRGGAVRCGVGLLLLLLYIELVRMGLFGSYKDTSRRGESGR